MKKIFILLMISSPVLAMEWSTEFHHIEPLLREANTAVKKISDPDQCLDSTAIPILSYISDRPKTEVWRSYYKPPTLITSANADLKKICEEAKTQNLKDGTSKKYALIAHKTHFCDGEHNACLSTFKSVSDPCNLFVQDNFQVFHTRTWINSQKSDGSDAIKSIFGPNGPSLFVIELATCSLLPTVKAQKFMTENNKTASEAAQEGYNSIPPSMDNKKDSQGIYQFKSQDDRVRFAAMKESLLTHISALKDLDTGKVDCFVDGKRTLAGLADTDEIQYGELKTKGIIGVRKLMDEQYIEVTKKNPYKRE